MAYKVYGKIVAEETGQGIPGLVVEAFDKDILFDDFLGAVTSDQNGYFEITYEQEDFKELFFDLKPDIYLKVKDAEGELIYTNEEKARYNAGEAEEFLLRIAYDRALKAV